MENFSANKSHSPTKSLRKLLWVVLTAAIAIGGFMIANGTDVSTKKVYTVEFEKAVALIKKYEGMHKNHPTLIGYGHQVIAGDKYKRRANLTLAQADELLRDDLSKLCARYRSFGQDSLLLAALAYNCGIGTVARSSVYKNLQAGNRNIESAYLAHSKSRGKTLSQLKRRRQEELDSLFSPTLIPSPLTAAI
ncbi:MAG: glycoside hydrolase family protein [Muribaculaceae bacterium]|nr:glycoside hydrolase family protein [Muribaculaceae bacterium]MDE6753695.1 glycoside hydrolase family protein [Muribaculaceae bacterium]